MNKRIKKLKAKFIGLEFSEGSLYIRVLKDVNEFYEEGNALKHCVFTNEYFLKPDTLVFTAQINGKRIETVEVSFRNLESYSITWRLQRKYRISRTNYFTCKS